MKPDIWQSEAVGNATVQAQCLFVGLITQADDHGRLRGSADRLRATIWPYKPDIDAARVDEWLNELAARDLVQRYEHDGKPYIFLPGWYEHQRIQRPSDSDLPAPPPHGATAGSDPSDTAHGSDTSATAPEDSSTTHESSRRTPAGSGKGSGSGETPSASETLAWVVRRLFAYWQEQCRHPHSKLTPERRRKCEARLREGYTESQCREAIDGAARAAFVNDQGKRFDDFELIFRNGSKLESFIDRARSNGASSNGMTETQALADHYRRQRESGGDAA